VWIPKQHEAVLKSIERIAHRQGLNNSKVVLGILMYFLKQMNEIGESQSQYLKRRHIDKAMLDYSKTKSTELVESNS